MKLIGRNAIITGGSQGLGLEIAKYFLKEGANVAICARNAKTLEEAHSTLKSYTNENTKLITVSTDVSKIDQVDNLIQKTLEAFGSIDILVANAGIYGTKGPIDEVDWDEWSNAIDINLKGTVLQCRAVVPLMKKQGHGKIVILSGGGATKPLPNLSAYAASKAAVVRFAETLAVEVSSYNIDINSVAPGSLNTRFLDEIIEAGADKVGADFYAQSVKQKENGGTSLEYGANLCVFLASSASDGISGKLLSALWDPWQNLGSVQETLRNSDIYTLRRIIPTDRGENWA
ncbi:MAG: SDR family NAD(P)-dependent oxidoreductase [Legionellaceae bacterium]|nr:SDR family NAD(P)-dependent oxidoreductase [Legionellaceae bacterium]